MEANKVCTKLTLFILVFSGFMVDYNYGIEQFKLCKNNGFLLLCSSGINVVSATYENKMNSTG